MTENEFNSNFTNFKMSELSCHDKYNSQVPIQFRPDYIETLKILQFIRTLTGKKIFINSGYRTEIYNKSIGGASKSYHTFNASAVDFRLHWIHNSEESLGRLCDALNAAQKCGMIKPGGLHLYKNGKNSFIHIDIRGNCSRWSG